MPFKQVFERNVNENMQEDEDGQASRSAEAEEANIKKDHDAKQPISEDEEEDQEMAEKKDRPPRFSTLFGGSPAPVVIETQAPPPKRRSGVFLPMPLFVVFAVILLVESTFLFAYTIMGLYSQLPSQLLGFGGPSPGPINGCNCAQPAINIAPNFFAGGADTTGAKVLQGGATISPSSSAVDTSSSTTSTSKDGGVKVVTYTPPPGTIVTKTKVSTATPSTVSSDPPNTVYATVNEDGSTLPTTATSTTADAAAKRRSIASALAGANAALTPEALPSPSTLKRAASPPETTDAPSLTEDKAGDSEPTTTSDGGMGCFGAGGAVMQYCPGVIGNGK